MKEKQFIKLIFGLFSFLLWPNSRVHMQDRHGYVWLPLSGIAENEQSHDLQMELCHTRMKSSDVSCCSMHGIGTGSPLCIWTSSPGFVSMDKPTAICLAWQFSVDPPIVFPLVKMSYLGNKDKDSQAYCSVFLTQLVQSRHDQNIWWIGWPVWWEIRNSLI